MSRSTLKYFNQLLPQYGWLYKTSFRMVLSFCNDWDTLLEHCEYIFVLYPNLCDNIKLYGFSSSTKSKVLTEWWSVWCLVRTTISYPPQKVLLLHAFVSKSIKAWYRFFQSNLKKRFDREKFVQSLRLLSWGSWGSWTFRKKKKILIALALIQKILTFVRCVM